MKNIPRDIKKPFFLLFLFVCLLCCRRNTPENEACLKYAEEIYAEEKTDTALVRDAHEEHEYLLKKFGESSLKGLHYDAYQLLFFSSFGHGKSVRFEKKDGRYFLRSTCIASETKYRDCKNFQTEIREDHWLVLENMMYEFDFWTTQDIRANKGAMHGYVFILEGIRPDAGMCNKKTYRLVVRGSPRYDKIGVLCNAMLDYEEEVEFDYEQ